MGYSKTITQSDTGMVIAVVRDRVTDERVGVAFFHWPFFSQKLRLKRAHAWDDKWAKNCQDHCCRNANIEQEAP